MWFGIRAFIPLPSGYYEEPEYVNLISNNSEPDTEQTDIDFTSPTPAPVNTKTQATNTRLKQTAWIPDFDFTNGYNSFVKNHTYFDSVSPVWYQLDENGKVLSNQQRASELRSFTTQNGIKLIPSIASFSAERLHKILNNEKKFNEHIQYLKDQIEKFNLDGLDLDHESIYLEDKPEYLELTRQLYEYLDARGKKLSMAVIPKWTDSDINYSYRQTRESQDWQEISRYVHELRIMSYAYASSSTKYPAPISPIDWNWAILRYAQRYADADKIYMGIALYGLDGWSQNPDIPQPYLGLNANGNAGSIQVDAVTYKDVETQRAKYQTDKYIEEYSEERVLEYTYNGKNYIIFYMDKAALAPRLDLAKHFGIAGIAHWRLGGEQSGIYSLIEN